MDHSKSTGVQSGLGRQDRGCGWPKVGILEMDGLGSGSDPTGGPWN